MIPYRRQALKHLHDRRTASFDIMMSFSMTLTKLVTLCCWSCGLTTTRWTHGTGNFKKYTIVGAKKGCYFTHDCAD